MAESGRLEFTDITEWGEACHARGLWLFGTTKGSEARFPTAYEKLWGFWEYGTHKGWLEHASGEEKSDKSLPQVTL